MGLWLNGTIVGWQPIGSGSIPDGSTLKDGKLHIL
jgi:hypothetical protein